MFDEVIPDLRPKYSILGVPPKTGFLRCLGLYLSRQSAKFQDFLLKRRAKVPIFICRNPRKVLVSIEQVMDTLRKIGRLSGGFGGGFRDSPQFVDFC